MITRGSLVWWLSWLVVTVAVFPLPAARSQSSELARSGPAVDRDTVVIGTVENEPNGLNPFFGRGQQESFWEIFTVLFTQDVQRDAAWRPFPQGVEYLPSAGDGTWRLDGEKMTLVWRLRPRQWHDGHPVTCADYVFTHRLQRDEQVRERSGLNRIANVSCPKARAGWRSS